jgi:hypothetical protein
MGDTHFYEPKDGHRLLIYRTSTLQRRFVMSQTTTEKLPVKPMVTTNQNRKASTAFDIHTHYRNVLAEIGMSPEDAGGKTTFLGEDPIFESVHRIGACISIPIMAAAGVATVWRMRTRRGQDLTLDLLKAIHGVNPVYKFRPTINGYAYQMPYAVGNNMIFDLYLTKDGRCAPSSL